MRLLRRNALRHHQTRTAVSRCADYPRNVTVDTGCGLNYHKRCASKVPNNCNNSRQRRPSAIPLSPRASLSLQQGQPQQPLGKKNAWHDDVGLAGAASTTGVTWASPVTAAGSSTPSGTSISTMSSMLPPPISLGAGQKPASLQMPVATPDIQISQPDTTDSGEGDVRIALE